MSDFESREGMERRHADDAGDLGDEAFIRSQIDADFESFLIVVADESELPSDTSIRQNGIFDDPKACLEWLSGWGVSFDENSEPVAIGWVYAIRVELEDGQFEYAIYVRDDSP